MHRLNKMPATKLKLKTDESLAANLWELYQKHKSYRVVGELTGRSHDNIRYWLAKGGYDITCVDKPPTIPRASAKKQVGARIDAKDADFLESLSGGTTYQVYLAVTEYVNRLRAAVR